MCLTKMSILLLLDGMFCTYLIQFTKVAEHKDVTRKGSYKPISLINTDSRILNKILANQIQHYVKRIYSRNARMVQHLTNQSMWCMTLTK